MVQFHPTALVVILESKMTFVSYKKNENGRRCYILGRYRLHHGTFGIFVISIGIILAGHDIRDYRKWFNFNE